MSHDDEEVQTRHTHPLKSEIHLGNMPMHRFTSNHSTKAISSLLMLKIIHSVDIEDARPSFSLLIISCVCLGVSLPAKKIQFNETLAVSFTLFPPSII